MVSPGSPHLLRGVEVQQRLLQGRGEPAAAQLLPRHLPLLLPSHPDRGEVVQLVLAPHHRTTGTDVVVQAE